MTKKVIIYFIFISIFYAGIAPLNACKLKNLAAKVVVEVLNDENDNRITEEIIRNKTGNNRAILKLIKLEQHKQEIRAPIQGNNSSLNFRDKILFVFPEITGNNLYKRYRQFPWNITRYNNSIKQANITPLGRKST